MKELFYLATIFALTCTSCENLEPEHPEPEPPLIIDTISHVVPIGKIIFNFNLKDWEGSYYAHTYKNSSVFAIGFGKPYNSIADEGGIIHDIPFKAGRHLIRNRINNPPANPIEYTFGSYGVFEQDVFIASYNIDTTLHEKNFIDLIRFNPIDSTVEGRFQMQLYRKYYLTGYNPPFVDTIRITDGKFYMKLKQL